jgi:hypothetical protein
VKVDAEVAKERFSEFLGRMLAAQANAGALGGGATRRRFRIAGNEIELCLAHPALAEIFCSALAHLEISSGEKLGFAIHIWDETSPGIGSRTESLDHGQITTLIDAEHFLKVTPCKSIIAAHRPSGKAAVWLQSRGDVEEWERAAPLLELVNWWASGFGYFNVHAASVGRPDGGVLIVGPGGVGKSHTAIACLDSDLFYVADDHCLLEIGACPSTASVYSTAKVFAADLHRFPMLQRREKEAYRTQEDKAVFYLNEIIPQRLSPGFPIRAVLLPHPSGRRDTQIMRTSASMALLWLGPDNVLRWPASAGRLAFGKFASTLRSVPCFRLEAGTDLSQIPKAIASLLDNVSPLATA